MNIRDFLDLRQLQEMQDKFSDATGLAAIIVDAKGENVTKGSNFTDFCMKYTRGSEEGNRRCNKCSSENSGVYYCHAGLMEFCIDIMLGNEKVGEVIGGQVLSRKPDEDAFRKTATDLDIDSDAYINTSSLKSIANKQKMLSLNASIEAARSGEAGVGFAVVAKSMGELSSQSATIYGDIEKSVIEVTDSIEKLAAL